jgi:5-(carboxyamino)imidazole ribonucleotide synthase
MEAMNGAPAILEGFVAFDREISVVVARSASGDVAAFPVAENVHTNHILDTTTVPAKISDVVEAKAKVMAARIANALEYVGVMAVEMFVSDGTGEIIVNEIAPRVHNSGHWTVEGAETSQFEQHIRAICDLPLGPTDARGRVLMKNLLGKDILEFDKYLTDPKAHFHHYGKQEPREGRKMGHVTWVEDAE